MNLKNFMSVKTIQTITIAIYVILKRSLHATVAVAH